MERWEKNFYISSVAGASDGSSLVVMSKGELLVWVLNVQFSAIKYYMFIQIHKLNSGTPYSQQSYKVSESFPFKWINKKWKEGFYVTSMATSGTRWAVVMSRGAGFSNQVFSRPRNTLPICPHISFVAFPNYITGIQQVVELDFLYPSEGIHQRWENGYRITATAATSDQAAFVLSVPRRKPVDETQETLRTSTFPTTHAKVGPPSFTTPLHRLCTCYWIWFITGKMGEKSVHCLGLLWAYSFLEGVTTWTSESHTGG